MNGTRFVVRTLCAGAVALAAGTAQGQYVTLYNAPVSFAGSNLNGIPGAGTGNPNSNFEVAINQAAGIEIGLKAIERYVGDLPAVLDTYFAQPGISMGQGGAPNGATWNYFLVANLGPKTVADYDVQLDVDFDPGVNTQTWVSVDVDAVLVSQGAGGLSIFGDSQNLAFSFWQTLGAPTFDPNATGAYDLALTVYEKGTPNVLAKSDIRVVVPTPGVPAALGLLGVVAARRRRR